MESNLINTNLSEEQKSIIYESKYIKKLSICDVDDRIRNMNLTHLKIRQSEYIPEVIAEISTLTHLDISECRHNVELPRFLYTGYIKSEYLDVIVDVHQIPLFKYLVGSNIRVYLYQSNPIIIRTSINHNIYPVNMFNANIMNSEIHKNNQFNFRCNDCGSITYEFKYMTDITNKLEMSDLTLYRSGKNM